MEIERPRIPVAADPGRKCQETNRQMKERTKGTETFAAAQSVPLLDSVQNGGGSFEPETCPDVHQSGL